jgi:hypothetical protein
MAVYLLRNSLNPNKVVSCSITFRKITNKGEEGEPIWLVEVVTPEPHKEGGEIPPEYIHYTSELNLDEEIRKVTQVIAGKIDWTPLSTDTRPPFVSYYTPNSDVASIYSNVVVDIEDILPAAGIDVDSISVVINDIDVTDEVVIDGDPYAYRIRWGPEIRVFESE